MVRVRAPLFSLSAHGWLGRYTYGRLGIVKNPYPIDLFNFRGGLISQYAFNPAFLSFYYNKKGWCYQRRRTWHGIIYSAMSPPISVQPKSGDQIWWEKIFADAVAGWHLLTGLEKGVWNSYSYPKHPSGYNRFIRSYLKQNYPTPNMKPGSVVFIGADGRLAENNSNFYWDNANKELVLGGDGKISRSAANKIRIHGNFQVDWDAAVGTLNVYTGQTGIKFAGSGVSYDVNLYRSAANILKTDDKFDAAGGFSVGGSDGVTGTFVDNNGNTVAVTKGIITDLGV